MTKRLRLSSPTSGGGVGWILGEALANERVRKRRRRFRMALLAVVVGHVALSWLAVVVSSEPSRWLEGLSFLLLAPLRLLFENERAFHGMAPLGVGALLGALWSALVVVADARSTLSRASALSSLLPYPALCWLMWLAANAPA